MGLICGCFVGPSSSEHRTQNGPPVVAPRSISRDSCSPLAVAVPASPSGNPGGKKQSQDFPPTVAVASVQASATTVSDAATATVISYPAGKGPDSAGNNGNAQVSTVARARLADVVGSDPLSLKGPAGHDSGNTLPTLSSTSQTLSQAFSASTCTRQADREFLDHINSDLSCLSDLPADRKQESQAVSPSLLTIGPSSPAGPSSIGNGLHNRATQCPSQQGPDQQGANQHDFSFGTNSSTMKLSAVKAGLLSSANLVQLGLGTGSSACPDAVHVNEALVANASSQPMFPRIASRLSWVGMESTSLPQEDQQTSSHVLSSQGDHVYPGSIGPMHRPSQDAGGSISGSGSILLPAGPGPGVLSVLQKVGSAHLGEQSFGREVAFLGNSAMSVLPGSGRTPHPQHPSVANSTSNSGQNVLSSSMAMEVSLVNMIRTGNTSEPPPLFLQLSPGELNEDLQELSWIGQGASGDVYKGLWQGAPVAVKYIISPSINTTAAMANEALLSKMLSHPNVVQTFVSKATLMTEQFFSELFISSGKLPSQAFDQSDPDFPAPNLSSSFTSDDGFGNPLTRPQNLQALQEVVTRANAKPGYYLAMIIMEHCDKGSLLLAIKKGIFRVDGRWGPKLATRAMLRTAREVAQGMWHIHQSNVVHGDLKPGNVLLKGSRADRRGFVAKVSDFGLAKLCGNTSVKDSSHWGTVNYMAPEAFEGVLTKASDVYSFGMLLWEMSAGERPYSTYHMGQVIVGVQSGTLRPEWPPHVHPRLLKLGLKCLQQDRSLRPTFLHVMKELSIIESMIRLENTSASGSHPQSVDSGNPGSGSSSVPLVASPVPGTSGRGPSSSSSVNAPTSSFAAINPLMQGALLPPPSALAFGLLPDHPGSCKALQEHDSTSSCTVVSSTLFSTRSSHTYTSHPTSYPTTSKGSVQSHTSASTCIQGQYATTSSPGMSSSAWPGSSSSPAKSAKSCPAPACVLSPQRGGANGCRLLPATTAQAQPHLQMPVLTPQAHTADPNPSSLAMALLAAPARARASNQPHASSMSEEAAFAGVGPPIVGAVSMGDLKLGHHRSCSDASSLARAVRDAGTKASPGTNTATNTGAAAIAQPSFIPAAVMEGMALGSALALADASASSTAGAAATGTGASSSGLPYRSAMPLVAHLLRSYKSTGGRQGASTQGEDSSEADGSTSGDGCAADKGRSSSTQSFAIALQGQVGSSGRRPLPSLSEAEPVYDGGEDGEAELQGACLGGLAVEYDGVPPGSPVSGSTECFNAITSGATSTTGPISLRAGMGMGSGVLNSVGLSCSGSISISSSGIAAVLAAVGGAHHSSTLSSGGGPPSGASSASGLAVAAASPSALTMFQGHLHPTSTAASLASMHSASEPGSGRTDISFKHMMGVSGHGSPLASQADSPQGSLAVSGVRAVWAAKVAGRLSTGGNSGSGGAAGGERGGLWPL